MNSVLASQATLAPHLLPDISRRCSTPSTPTRSSTTHSTNGLVGRKRKAADTLNEEDHEEDDDDHRNLLNRTNVDDTTNVQGGQRWIGSTNGNVGSLNLSKRNVKRARVSQESTNLAFSRLIETLDIDNLRQIIVTICQGRSDILSEVARLAGRPSVDKVLGLITSYERKFRSAFPFGGRTSSDYSFNRVRGPLIEMLQAIKDYTVYFIPPFEMQTGISLRYLDGVTNVIHSIGPWDSYTNNRYKHEAYDELCQAWISVITEAGKRGSIMQLYAGEWDSKIFKHNERSAGRFSEVLRSINLQLEWILGPSHNTATPRGSGSGESFSRDVGVKAVGSI